MKKILCLIAFLLIPSLVFAAGSCSDSVTFNAGEIYEVTVTCTADASDGTFPNKSITLPSHGAFYFVSVEYAHGTSTQVTNNSDMTLLSPSGTDLLNGNGTDFMAAATTHAIASAKDWKNTYITPPVYGTLTQTVTQATTATNSATITLVYKFKKAF